MGNAFSNPTAQADDVIIRCVKPDTKLLEDGGATGFSRADKYEDDLHTSKNLLSSCSPIFATLLEKSHKKEQVLIVNKFCREDMALFLRFAAVNTTPVETSAMGSNGSNGSNRFEVSLHRAGCMKIMPIVQVYSCEGLWSNLIDWINSRPDLELLVTVIALDHFIMYKYISPLTSVV